MPSGKGVLRIAIEDFIETFVLGEVITDALKSGAESYETEIIKASSGAIEQVISVLDESDPVGKALAEVFRGEHQGGLVTLAGFGAQMGMGAASGMMAPLMRKLNYAMDKNLKTARADPNAAIAMSWRTPEFAKDAVEGMIELGWSDNYMKAWAAAISPTVPEGDLLTLWYRFPDMRVEIEQELKLRGWEDGRVQQLITAREIIPQVQDLITMAVREAFTPDIVDRYNLHAEFPDDFAGHAAKHGLSEKWAKDYWASHWQLPSVQLGYEMFHRLRPDVVSNPFTEDDLKLLLRTQDIAPYWRQFLVDISYRPLTRVDVRRMFRDGVLTVGEVDSAYRDLGYNDVNAGRMTDWTVKESRSTEKELTRSAVIKGYKKKTLSYDETSTALSQIGYDENEVLFWMKLADLNIEEQMLDEEIDRVSFLYVEGEINETDVYGELGRFNLPSEQMEHLLNRWNIQRRKKISLPTRSDLEGFYKRGIIEYEEFLDGMKRRRYDDETILWYAMQLDQEVAEAAILEMERARREQERLLTAEASTVYAQEKAGLDTEIAQAKVAIAEIKLALHSIEDTEQIKALKERIDNIKLFITQVQLSKAYLKQDFEDTEL